VITPHHVAQFAIRDARLDVAAVQTERALHVKTVCPARDRALGVDRAGALQLVQHRAHDRPGGRAGEFGHLVADVGQALGRQRGEALLQQGPFRRGQSRDVGQLPAAGGAAARALPVGV